jgi:hypothetical protein
MLKLAEKERNTLESAKNKVETYICYFKFTGTNLPALIPVHALARAAVNYLRQELAFLE